MTLTRHRDPAMERFQAAAKSDALADVLRSIEDKLHERGMLVTATGDPEADVTLAFGIVRTGDERVPAMTISITSNAAVDAAEADWERINDYVAEKFHDMQGSLPGDIRETLEASCGQYVFLNGDVVY